MNPHNADTTHAIAAKGLEANPGESGEVFGENAPYFRVEGNRKQRDQIEEDCQRVNQKHTAATGKNLLLNTTSECTIEGKKSDVLFTDKGIEHYSQDLFGDKQRFWVKNAILKNIDKYIRSAQCVGRKLSDTTHNTRKETVKLKENTDYFYYFKIQLPNGMTSYLHLGRYKSGHEREGKMYFYSITKNPPKNIETL